MAPSLLLSEIGADAGTAADLEVRADDAAVAVAAAVGLSGKSAAQVFAEVRARKNKF